MGLIRNFFQVARYLATSTADERVERRLQLGKTDAERREDARRVTARNAALSALAVVLLALAAIHAVGGA